MVALSYCGARDGEDVLGTAAAELAKNRPWAGQSRGPAGACDCYLRGEWKSKGLKKCGTISGRRWTPGAIASSGTRRAAEGMQE